VALVAVVALAFGVAEAKLIYYSYRYRDLASSSQGLLLADRGRLEGRQVFSARWERAEIFVLEALVEGRHRLASDFFQNSSFGTTKATFTGAQAGPFHLEAGSTGGAAGGGTLALMDPQTDGRRLALVVDNRGSGKGGAPHLHVIDVTRPSEPAEAGRADLPASPFCVRITGNLALIGHSRGVTVIDVSAPSDPKVAGEYRKPTLAGVQVMAVDGDCVFVSPDEAIHILRLRR
jgi:hypothetical protein